jgi:hypothetical protein
MPENCLTCLRTYNPLIEASDFSLQSRSEIGFGNQLSLPSLAWICYELKNRGLVEHKESKYVLANKSREIKEG